MVLIMQNCENCCVFTESSGRKAWTRVAKWKAIIMSRDGPRDSWGKKALNFQILIVCYLKFVEGKHLQAALCLIDYGA